MNLKTTAALLILVAAGGTLYWFGPDLPPQFNPLSRPPAAAEAGSREVLEALAHDGFTRVVVRHGDRVTTLERGVAPLEARRATPDWALPGNWPVRPEKVKELTDLLIGLHSRFEAVPLDEGADGDPYGLKSPPVTVEVRLRDGAKHTLAFGEPTGGEDGNRFSRPTYLRIDGRPEVVRLGPGLVATLSRPTDYYQQRRLFPGKRVPRDENSRDKVERLSARHLTVSEKDGPRFSLARLGDDWELSQPSRDRLEPGRRDSLLEAVPDLWAERFVRTDLSVVADAWTAPLAQPHVGALATALFWNTRSGVLVKTGLSEPRRTVAVTRTDGATVTLLVGNPATVRQRRVPRRPPPGAPPGMRLPDENVPETYLYAKLQDNDQLFEIRADRLNDVFVSPDDLRDARLARFKAEDVRRLEIAHDGQTVVLVNAVDEEMVAAGASALGLLAERWGPLLAAAALYPDRVKARWKLEQPLRVAGDADRVNEVVSKLADLQARDKDAEATTRNASAAGTAGLLGAGGPLLASSLLAAERRAQDYGFEKPLATVRVTLVEEDKVNGEVKGHKKRTVTFQLGRHDAAAHKLYVKTDDWPRVNEVEDALAPLARRPPLAYRGKRLFDFRPASVERVSVRRLDLPALGAGAFGLVTAPSGPGLMAAVAALAADRTTHLTLERDGDAWRLTAPVSAGADAEAVRRLGERLGQLEALDFVEAAPSARDLAGKYGLGVPALSVTLTFTGKDKPPQTLQVGKQRPGAPGYFARIEGSPEVFALGDDLHDLLDRDALAYRPAELWKLPPGDAVVGLKIHKAGQDPYQLTRQGEGWQVTGPFTVTPPREVVDALTAALAAPQAREYRAHAAADLAPFGLASPEVTVTVTTKSGKEHTLLIGEHTSSGVLGRFAKFSSSPAVFVVGDDLARKADQSALDFLDRTVLKFDAGAATGLRRQAGAEVLELVKKEDAWRLSKPDDQPGDEKKVSDLLKQLGELRARRIAAYPIKDLKPFGLAEPEAVVTVTEGEEGKATRHVIELGKVADEGTGDRFARVKGAKMEMVSVLPGALVKSLLGGPLAFRDHDLARFADADRMRLEHGRRKAVFGKVEGTWKLVEPLQADADHEALEAFLNGLARLRADELIAENPAAAQLKGFGLERPLARWRLEFGEKEVLDLSVGKAEKGGARHYARLGGKGLVFLLDPKTSAGTLTEYRPRAVWKAPLDAAQVESVRFGFAGKPFELKKVEAGWQVVGKPDVKVNAAAVDATLAALRDLKLERYAVDQGAELKLFGLRPADLVLEATTPSEKRTLHVGGLEDGGRRRYAHLPEPGRTDVFLLDEKTSGQIFRDLAAFARPAAP